MIARDVLAYIDWVEWLLWVEQHRQDPMVKWQEDLSFDTIAEWAGVDAPLLRPGDALPTVLGTAQLYWPAVEP